MNIYMYLCMYVRTYVCMCVCVCLHVCVCVCIVETVIRTLRGAERERAGETRETTLQCLAVLAKVSCQYIVAL
jgi:hypothetical protein